MIELTNARGHVLRVEDEESAKFWTDLGYRAAESKASASKSTSKRASSSKSSK